jgi:hypothetical protein
MKECLLELHVHYGMTCAVSTTKDKLRKRILVFIAASEDFLL